MTVARLTRSSPRLLSGGSRDENRAPSARDETRSDLLLYLVGDTGIEPVTFRVNERVRTPLTCDCATTCTNAGAVERSSARLNAVQRRWERHAAPNLLPAGGVLSGGLYRGGVSTLLSSVT